MYKSKKLNETPSKIGVVLLRTMNVTKNAYIRYHIIDDCLTNPHFKATKTNIKSRIEEEIGSISTRQIEADFATMGTPPINAPIKCHREGREYIYRYEFEDKTLHKFRIPESALQQLEDALEILQQMRGAPFLNPVRDYVEHHLRQHKRKIPKREVPAILFEENPNLKGLEYFIPIYEAILKHNVLRIHYKEFGASSVKQYIIHPYLLKSFNLRWFLFGKNQGEDNSNKKWNTPLDRIEKIEILEGADYHKLQLFDWHKHFDEVIGVTHVDGATKERIDLRLSKKRLPYVITKPIHPSQELIDEDGGIRIYVRPNRELYQKLLSFGEDIEVLSPQSVRDQMQDHLYNALSKYEKKYNK